MIHSPGGGRVQIFDLGNTTLATAVHRCKRSAARMGNGDRRETSFFPGNKNGPVTHGDESGSIAGYDRLWLAEIVDADGWKHPDAAHEFLGECVIGLRFVLREGDLGHIQLADFVDKG